MFDGVEIVSDKTRAAYADIFHRHETQPDRTLMAGNSMKSDVLPAIEAGAWGVYIPHGLTWALEAAEPPTRHPRYRQIEGLSLLPEVIHEIENHR